MQSSALRSCKVLLFDLDGTLYPSNHAFINRCRENIYEYMEDKLNIRNAREVQLTLFRKYNQTIRGLRAAGYDFDVAEFWRESRKGSKEFFSSAPPHITQLIDSLPQDKYVFTNCNEVQAKEVLDLLGISTHFKKIFGAAYMGDFCKPEREVFDKILEDLSVDPHEVALFEDSFKNLATAKKIGMTTVLVDGRTAVEEQVTEQLKQEYLDGIVTYETFSKDHLQSQIPFLWEGC